MGYPCIRMPENLIGPTHTRIASSATLDFWVGNCYNFSPKHGKEQVNTGNKTSSQLGNNWGSHAQSGVSLRHWSELCWIPRYEALGSQVEQTKPQWKIWFCGCHLSWLVVYLPLWKIWKSVGIILPNISRNYPGTPQACTACMGATLSLGIDQVYTSLLWEQYRMPMGALWENSWLMLWYVQPHQMMRRRDRNETCTFHKITL